MKHKLLKYVYETKKKRLLASDKYKEIKLLYDKLINEKHFDEETYPQYFKNIEKLKNDNR